MIDTNKLRRIGEMMKTHVVKTGSPIVCEAADEIDRLRDQLASRGVPDARWLLDQYEAFIAAIPVGQEDSTRGASAYNWHRAAKATLESLLAAAPSPEGQEAH